MQEIPTWSASTVSTWIHTTSTGNGNGTVNFTFDANTSINTRSGTISVGGQSFTVNQVGISCIYALNSTSFNHGSGAESGSFGVTSPTGCSWAATTASTWIHTSSSGSGNGTVNYAIDANTSISTRSGTIVVGGLNYTVNQAALVCDYAISTTSASFSSSVGSGSVNVTSPTGCSWS